MTKFEHIQVIINPASGANAPILNTINRYLSEVGSRWDVSVTQPERNAAELTQEALDKGADLIAVYGGDGTLHEVNSVLAGTETPLCILPGGTGNALAKQLRIPLPLEEALQASLMGPIDILELDTAIVNDKPFLLNAGTGLYGQLLNVVDRELKDRFGWIAYLIGAVRTTTGTELFNYEVTVDGKTHTFKATACLVANANHLGVLGLALPEQVSLTDGYLDVFAMDSSVMSILGGIGRVTGLDTLAQTIPHWRGQQITIQIETQQGVYVDGEADPICETPAHVQIRPQSLRVIVPSDHATP